MWIAPAFTARPSANEDWWGERTSFLPETVPKFNVRLILGGLCGGGVLRLINPDIGKR
jgi:hypothetical protein